MTMEPGNKLIPLPPQTLNKNAKVLAIRQSEAGASDYVTHLTTEQVKRLADAVESTRMGKRDSLLIKLLFDTAMRVSEALTVRPCDLEEDSQGWHIRVKGKGNRVGICAVSSQLVMQLQSFAYSSKLDPSALFFPFNRSRAWQIISRAYKSAGILQPSKERDRVGCVHVLRHSGCIERLKQTGNPRAVQDQLRHKSSQMTLRYMRTLSAKESLAINENIRFDW